MNEPPRPHEQTDPELIAVERRLMESASAEVSPGAHERIERALHRAAHVAVDRAQPTWWRIPTPRWQAVAASLLVGAGASLVTAWLMMPSPAVRSAVHEVQQDRVSTATAITHYDAAWPTPGSAPLTDIRAWQPAVVN